MTRKPKPAKKPSKKPSKPKAETTAYYRQVTPWQVMALAKTVQQLTAEIAKMRKMVDAAKRNAAPEPTDARAELPAIALGGVKEDLAMREKLLDELLADLAQMTAARDDPSFDDVAKMAARWHYTECDRIAKELLGELEQARADSLCARVSAHGFLRRLVTDRVDAHDHVINEAKAEMLLVASANRSAYWQEFGEAADLTRRAACALTADIWERLEARIDEWDTDESASGENADG